MINTFKNINTDKETYFTPRELEVIYWVYKGLDNKEISEILAIKQRTVKTFLENIYAKISVHNRVQLVVYAMKNGLVYKNTKNYSK